MLLKGIAAWGFDLFQRSTPSTAADEARRNNQQHQTGGTCAYSYTVVHHQLVAGHAGVHQQPAPEIELAPTDLTHLVRHSSLPWAMFYRTVLDQERLREALAQVLGQYVALAGRLEQHGNGNLKTDMNPKASLVLNNKGASFTVLETTASANNFGGFDDGPAAAADDDSPGGGSTSDRSQCSFHTEASNVLPPYVDEIQLEQVFKGKAPLLYVKLTLLRDGGCILGVTFPHIVGDGHSMEMFLSALSTAYNSLLGECSMLGPTPTNDRYAFMKDAPDMTEALPPDAQFARVGWARIVWKLITATWRMSYGDVRRVAVTLPAEKVSQLKGRLSAHVSGAGGDYITSNDALVTFAWLVLRAVRGRPNTTTTKYPPRIVQAVNLRGRMPNVPLHFFGNSTWISVADAPSTSSPVQMAMSVRKSVAAWCDEEYARSWAGRLKTFQGSDNSTVIRMSVWPFFSDGMVTSWQFTHNVWDLKFDGCSPYWFYGGIFPQISNFVIMYPAQSSSMVEGSSSASSSKGNQTSYKDCGVKISFSVPGKKIPEVKKEAERLLNELCAPV